MSTLKQQRRNRLHLADMLENRIADKNFNIRVWTNDCGTVGCALGIAVLSGEFGYGWNKGLPVKNGREAYWWEVGPDLFGDYTYTNVFTDFNPRSRQTVAAELRAIK